MQPPGDPPPPAWTPRVERLLSAVILILHVVLSVGFSLGPIFEGPDELEHFRFIQTVAQTGALPNALGISGSQYHHAPLYYLLAAPFAALAAPVDLFEYSRTYSNPFYGYAFFAVGNDNKNTFLHSRAEDFPYSGSSVARTVHLLRLISVALSAGTVLASRAVFRELWPDRPDRRLAALAFVAFQPQSVYLSGTLTNDNLLILAATLVLWLLVRQLRIGPARRSAVMLGLALGAALLAKVNALFLAIPVGAALLPDRRSWRLIPLVAAVTLIIAGWWFARNVALYGDLTGTRALYEGWVGEQIEPGALAFEWGLRRIPFAYQTFWARFGPGPVAVHGLIYRFFDGLLILTLLGLLIRFLHRIWQRRSEAFGGLAVRQAAVVGSFALTWLLLLVYYASRSWSGIQGRYLLPGLAAWAALFALGFDAWMIRPRLRGVWPAIAATALGGVCAITLFAYFLPSYRPLPPEQPAYDLPYRFEDAAELVGVSTSMIRARPGDVVDITLTWRALGPTGTELRSYLRSVDSAVVQRDSFPGAGNLLSTEWLPGETWSERTLMVIPPDAEPQHVYPLVAGLADHADGRLLAALHNGQEVAPYVGRIAINGPAAPFEPDYRFGDVVGLAEPGISVEGDSIEVCLRWVSLALSEADYHLFVHLLAKQGDLLAQYDGEPLAGRYPIGGWSVGEVVEECVTLPANDLPAEPHHLNVGLYSWPDGQRLPAVDAQGARLENDSVFIEVHTP